jgi:hypothetical protein
MSYKTAKEITDELVFRMKHMTMERFEVKRDVGLNWLPRGVIPFDITVKGGIATFQVYAEFLQDAEDQVSKFLEQDEDE